MKVPARVFPFLLAAACSGGGGKPAPEGGTGDVAGGDTAGVDTASGDTPGGDSGDTGGFEDWPGEGLVLDRAVLIDAGGRREGALLIGGGEILAELPAGMDWPAWLEVRDLGGGVIIPGLIDSHAHIYHSGATWWVGDTVADNLRATLYWGVTGVLDPGGPEVTWALRDRIARGSLIGPRMAATGPFLTAAGSHPCEGTYDRSLCIFVDGDGAERAAALDGADWLKVALVDNDFTDAPTPRLDLAELAAITAVGPPVLAHVAQREDVADALAAGVTALAHPVFAEPVDEATADLPFLSVHTTLSAFSGVVDVVEGADLSGPDYAATSPKTRGAWIYVQSRPEVLAEGWVEDNAGWAQQLRDNLAIYRRRGAPIVAGSDAGYWFVQHGRALHDELAALVDAGWTPLEALAAATSEPAAALGWSDQGWLGPGYRADLVVLEADPLEDIANTRRIRAVLLGGVWHTPEQILDLDLWQSSGEDFCLDDRDCGGGEGCDLVDHRCVSACEQPYAYAGACDEESWCMPADGLAATEEGVCHIEAAACDWRAQDCVPERYAESCLPLDIDTSTCWPSGDRGVGERCSWDDPELRCGQGLMCSPVDQRCYALCDPAGVETCDVGRCRQQYAAPGLPWFGLCQ